MNYFVSQRDGSKAMAGRKMGSFYLSAITCDTDSALAIGVLQFSNTMHPSGGLLRLRKALFISPWSMRAWIKHSMGYFAIEFVPLSIISLLSWAFFSLASLASLRGSGIQVLMKFKTSSQDIGWIFNHSNAHVTVQPFGQGAATMSSNTFFLSNLIPQINDS